MTATKMGKNNPAKQQLALRVYHTFCTFLGRHCTLRHETSYTEFQASALIYRVGEQITKNFVFFFLT